MESLHLPIIQAIHESGLDLDPAFRIDQVAAALAADLVVRCDPDRPAATGILETRTGKPVAEHVREKLMTTTMAPFLANTKNNQSRLFMGHLASIGINHALERDRGPAASDGTFIPLGWQGGMQGGGQGGPATGYIPLGWQGRKS